MSTVVFLLNLAECEIFYAYGYENVNISWHFHINQQRKFHAQLSWACKKFYNLGACSCYFLLDVKLDIYIASHTWAPNVKIKSFLIMIFVKSF